MARLFLWLERRLLRVIAWLDRWIPGRSTGRAAAGTDTPPPPEWEAILQRNVGLYERLMPAEQQRLHQLMRGLLAGKRWVGCGGLEVTEEMKVTVAAQACVLLLGTIDHDHFASVTSILVYPDAFAIPDAEDDLDDDLENETHADGQAWYRGPVILAWDEVIEEGRDPDGEGNVVYHEFAHQLDFAGESLQQAAAPDAEEKCRRRNAVLKKEYEALVRAAEKGRATLLDQYGATDEREFFAVATECFFGRPIEMQRSHGALYSVLADFYGQDPAERLRRYQAVVQSTQRRDRLG